MKIEQRCTVPVAREPLWRFLMDVPAMAGCVPGVEKVEPRGDNRYEGRMKVRVGPIALTLDGAMAVREQDDAGYRAAVDAEANDRRVGGGVHVNAQMSLRELAPGETELVVTTDARLLG
jgi:carbon monoxide dehydrogenase subunit G